MAITIFILGCIVITLFWCTLSYFIDLLTCKIDTRPSILVAFLGSFSTVILWALLLVWFKVLAA